eukprot:IDg10091t1
MRWGYSHNAKRCEAANVLGRYQHTLLLNPTETACRQWMERSLKDRANRHLAITAAFLLPTLFYSLYLTIHLAWFLPKVFAKHLNEELPFVDSENVMMDAVRKCGNRQTLDEAIGVKSIVAGKRIK